MHHGNFYSGESDKRQEDEGVGVNEERGTGMIWLPWRNVPSSKQTMAQEVE